MGARDTARPVHCRPTHDCTTWARDPRFSLEGRHSSWVHTEQDQFLSQLWMWIDGTLRSLQGQRSIAAATLPNPADPSTALPVGMLDPTTALILMAFGKIRGIEAKGIYVGFVGQNPNFLWQGLTGFFVPYCPGCDQDGEATLRMLRGEVRSRDITLESIWDLPVELHPQEGWFEGDRLMLGGLASPRAGLSNFWTRHAPPTDLEQAHLIAAGPVATSLANFVLLDDDDAIEGLERIRGPRSRWTFRTGSATALAELAHLGGAAVDRTRQVILRPKMAPTAWGSFRDQAGTWRGPYPNLRRAVIEWAEGREGTPSGIEIEHLPAGGAVRLTDLLELPSGAHKRHTPA